MVHDGNGLVRLSGWNWLGLLGFMVMATAASVSSHHKLANDVRAEVATISSAVKTNTVRIAVNKERISENRADIKTLHLNP